jgi:hypothetical protein
MTIMADEYQKLGVTVKTFDDSQKALEWLKSC